MTTYYSILGVPSDASPEKIKQAYRELIRRYHPDLNADTRGSYTRITQSITEAYAVLKDPVKRLEYDLSLSVGADPSHGTYGEAEPAEHTGQRAEEHEPDIVHHCCEKCGAQDPTLRAVVFLWVFSYIIATSKRGWGGVLCWRCRVRHSLLYNLRVWCLGWWGFPWGPLFSIEALYKNLTGGIQPQGVNADMLATLGYDFYLQGRYAEAREALRASLSFECDDWTAEFLEHLDAYPHDDTIQTPNRLVQPSYNLALLSVLGLLSFWGFAALDGGGQDGYRAHYAQQSVGGSDETPDVGEPLPDVEVDLTPLDRSAEGCNRSVAAMAAYIKERVPMTHTSNEGDKMIHHYKLDRTKLQAGELSRLRLQIRQELARGNGFNKELHGRLGSLSDEDRHKVRAYAKKQIDFMSAAYFNAALLEVSVRVLKPLQVSTTLNDEEVRRVHALRNDPLLRTWLRNNPRDKTFRQLLATLDATVVDQKSLRSAKSALNLLEGQLQADQTALKSLRDQMDQYRREGDLSSYNELVNKHNTIIRRGKRSTTKYNRLAKLANKSAKRLNNRDLIGAFNQCIDPAILFSEFDSVDLTAKGDPGEPQNVLTAL